MRPPDQISTAHRPGRDAGDAGDARPRASSTSLAGGAQSVGIGRLVQYTVGPFTQRGFLALLASAVQKTCIADAPLALSTSADTDASHSPGMQNTRWTRHPPIALPLSHPPLTPKPLRAARAAQPRRGERTPAPQVLRNPTRNVATTSPNSPTPVDNKHLSPDTPCASTPSPAWPTTNSLFLLVFFQGPQPDAVRR